MCSSLLSSSFAFPIFPSGMYYVCFYGHHIYIARVKTNRVKLPILLVVSRGTGNINISLFPFAPENLVSRDGFGSPVPRQPAYPDTQTEYGAYLRDSSRFPRRRPFIYVNRHTVRHRVSPEFIGSRNGVSMAFTAESPQAQDQQTSR